MFLGVSNSCAGKEGDTNNIIKSSIETDFIGFSNFKISPL